MLHGRRLLLVHGSPDDPLDGYVYPDTDLSPLADLPYDAFFLGNTHRPFVRQLGTKLVVNVGSVGLPRDHGGLASLAMYDAQHHACEILRVPWPVDEVLRRYAGAIHPSVIDCLRRQDANPVGRILP